MADAKKTKNVHVRLTPDELALLEDRSASTGRTMSDLIRTALKKQKIVELPPADFAEAVVQLRRIGNNLNQIARAANAGEVHIPEIKTVLSEIVAVDRRMCSILSGGDR